MPSTWSSARPRSTTGPTSGRVWASAPGYWHPALVLADLFSPLLLPTLLAGRREKARTRRRASQLLSAAGFQGLAWHDLYALIIKAVTATTCPTTSGNTGQELPALPCHASWLEPPRQQRSPIRRSVRRSGWRVWPPETHREVVMPAAPSQRQAECSRRHARGASGRSRPWVLSRS